MGCFSQTCAVSRLPIEGGCKVRIALLTENPFAHDGVYYPHGLWYPRTWPLRATYDDYGSVDNVEEGPALRAWFEAFKIDLVERGIGENPCHDVATRKDWSLDEMLNALQERRVRVRWRDVPGAPQIVHPDRYEGAAERVAAFLGRSGRKVPAGVPTRRRVEAMLGRAGVPLARCDGERGAIVQRLSYGQIRVRAEPSDQVSLLRKCGEAIGRRYPCMIARDAGSYAFGAALFVAPRHDADDYRAPRASSRPERSSLQVMPMLIREDVWQAIVARPLRDDWYDGETMVERYVTPADYAKAGLRWWDRLLSWEGSILGADDTTTRGGPEVAWPLRYGDDHLGLNLAASFGVAARLFKNGAMTEPERDAFLAAAGEFLFVRAVLGATRHLWQPSYAVGPQGGDWEAEERFAATVHRIAAGRHDEQKRAPADDEASP